MIFIYSPKASPEDLLTNGYGGINATEAIVSEELNGEYKISLSIPITDERAQYFVGKAIVRAQTPRGVDYFRLDKPKTTMKTKSATGWHISYDLAADMIVNSAWTAKTGQEALTGILSSGMSERRFTGTSDITTISNMRAVRCSPLSSLINTKQDNCFLNRWGGEAERSCFAFNVKNQIGTDNGVNIAFKKNLTGFNLDEDFSAVATRIVPTCLTADDGVLSLAETYIDSSRIGDYALPHIYAVHFSDIKVGAKDSDTGLVTYGTEADAMVEMRVRVAAMFSAGCDLPKVTATVEFILLQNTIEYKNYALLETVNLGDTIHCNYREIALLKRVKAYEFDSLKKRYNKITLGDLKRTVADTMYAQDIDLSALKTTMDSTVKQNDIYYGCSLNHVEGLKVTGSTALAGAKFIANADRAGYFDANDNFLGGLAIINSVAAVISSILTNTATNPECWATIGQSGGLYGVFIFRRTVSATVPVLKILLGSGGDFYLQNSDGKNIVDYQGVGGSVYIRNAVGNFALWAKDSFCQIVCPSANGMAVGADTGGPYKIINGIKSYL